MLENIHHGSGTTVTSGNDRPARESCWNTRGVFGDRSCDKLARVAHCRHCEIYTAAGRALLEQAPSPEAVAAWTQAIAGDRETDPPCLFRALAFRLGNEHHYALKIETLQEVMKTAPVQYVPHRSDHLFRGLVNVHGELVPCMSLSTALGLPAVAPPATGTALGDTHRMLVIGYGARDRYVCEVAGTGGVHPVNASHVHPAPATVSKSERTCMAGVLDIDEQPRGLIDEARLLSVFRMHLTGRGHQESVP